MNKARTQAPAIQVPVKVQCTIGAKAQPSGTDSSSVTQCHASAPLLHSATVQLSRRHWLAGLALAAFGLPNSDARAETAIDWQEAAPGVFWCSAANAEISTQNQGLVVHSAVLASGKQALLFDPGAHWQRGHALRESIRRDLGLRVTAVVDSHAHPEHVLGNSAFADVPIYASADTAKLMGQRCPACRQRLMDLLGAARMAGTRIVLPRHLLADGQRWHWQGRTLQVAVFDRAHSRGDLALFDESSRVLLAGGLANRERIPEMTEASLPGWLAALTRLQGLQADFVIGSGCGSAEQTLEATRAYLQTLNDVVREAIENGESEFAVLSSKRFDAWRDWAQFSDRHPLNVQHAWAELEAAWWQSVPAD